MRTLTLSSILSVFGFGVEIVKRIHNENRETGRMRLVELMNHIDINYALNLALKYLIEKQNALKPQ